MSNPLFLFCFTLFKDTTHAYSPNALSIFKARYLLKGNNGETVESLDQLFKRVAVSVGLMEVLYDEQFFDVKAGQKVNKEFIPQYKRLLEQLQLENKERDYADINNNPDNWEEFHINNYHIESFVARYIELYEAGHM